MVPTISVGMVVAGFDSSPGFYANHHNHITLGVFGGVDGVG
jgi:hypothetical protein